MKTFNDLEFRPHKGVVGIQARMHFDNGYGVSVVQGPYFYTDGPNEFEVAVLKGEELCYNTHITSDVLGHLSREEVTTTMQQVQELK